MTIKLHIIRILVTLLVFLFSFAGQAAGDDRFKTGPVDFTLEPILSAEWVCYIQGDGLFVKRMGNTPLEIRRRQDATGAIMSPSLSVLGDSLFIAWIEKGSGGNRVLFLASHDNGKRLGKAVELAARTKATQVRLLADKRERLLLIEAASDKEPEIILHLSLDRGESFKRIPLNIDGLDFLYNPTSVVIDDMLYLFFSSTRGREKQIGVKPFDISSEKPMDYIVIRETEEVSFIEAFNVKNAPAVIYKTSRGGKMVFEGAVRSSTGWETFSIKIAEGLDVARMDYHAWGDGRILIVFSGEERGKFKQRIYAAVSEDNGKIWDMRRIDSKESDNTRAWLPRLAVKDRLVAVVWEDSRDIRSAIRLNLSKDRGKTWLNKDILISDPKKISFRPKISLSKGDFYVSWHQFKNDAMASAEIILKKIDSENLINTFLKKDAGLSLKKKETLLRQRVNTYWKAMMKKDLKTTYMIHDPFFRAKIPYEYYASRRGPMIYHSYSITGIRIEDNIAFVKIKVKYEVPKLIIQGKETSIPPKEIEAEDIYLFIDGKWFRQFIDVLSGGSAIDY